jgi:two-component system, sensor histidine kinase and response regulator
VHGLNVFHPDLVQDSTFIPPVAITSFSIFNQPVPVGPDSPLRQPVEASWEIELQYTDDFFEFEFSALDFSSPQEIQYAYKMENLDKDWNYVAGKQYASYTNVPPGEYTFQVKATNSDGIWNEQGSAIHILIPPPFWQTAWFRLLVVLGVAGGISAVFVARLRSVEAQRRHLETLVEQRTHELRQAMGALEVAKEAAEAASRAKSTFLANMSHEFRTPLNAILGFTQIMIRDRALSSDERENVQIIHRSSEHLLGLINDVLEMSKIEAGRATLNQRSFDLHRMLTGLQEMFALRAESKGLVLKLELAPEVPRYIRSDEGKLRQVLMNLLGNSVKFTQQGHVILRVHPCLPPAGSSDPGVWLCFAVEDTGPGISQADLDILFTPFVQTSAGQQSPEGTGLGLPISQQFVRLMGGEIQVSSQEGSGSIFCFSLPVEAVQAGDLEKPPPSRRVIGLEPGQPVYRLLAVDDAEVNRRLLVKLFEPLGFEMRSAANGQEALEIWEGWQPHLIWMDMRMPVMDGYEATRRIKATTRGMATIIIALTASALEEDRSVILSEGCDDYIRKPFHEEDLYAAVARHLGVRYLYEDIEQPVLTGGPLPEAPEEDDCTRARRMQGCDPDWLVDLEHATILGDQQAILQAAGKVSRQDPALADEIIRLANGFDHDRILASIQLARQAEENATSP